MSIEHTKKTIKTHKPNDNNKLYKKITNNVLTFEVKGLFLYAIYINLLKIIF
jgi:hypothetical protein